MSKKNKGMTLVELVVVMALVVVFGGMVMTLFLSQNKNLQYVQDSTQLQNEARNILTSIEQDIRTGKSRDIVEASLFDGKQIYKFEKDSKTYGYFFDEVGSTVFKAEVASYGPIASTKVVLSENVLSIKFEEVSEISNTYDIKLTMKKGSDGEELSFDSRVTSLLN